MVAGCGCISYDALGDGGWMWLYELVFLVMVAGCGCMNCGALGDGGWMWLYELWCSW